MIQAHVTPPDPPQPEVEPPKPPTEVPRPIDDPKPPVDPPVRDPSPDERPNPKRYGPPGATIASGRTHSSYCASLT